MKTRILSIAVLSLLFACSKPVFVHFSHIKEHYGHAKFQWEYSAAQICKDMGYEGCLGGQLTYITTYYETTDGTCERPQLIKHNKSLYDCEMKGSPFGPPKCWIPPQSSAWEEPMKGDQSVNRILQDVICLE